MAKVTSANSNSSARKQASPLQCWVTKLHENSVWWENSGQKVQATGRVWRCSPLGRKERWTVTKALTPTEALNCREGSCSAKALWGKRVGRRRKKYQKSACLPRKHLQRFHGATKNTKQPCFLPRLLVVPQCAFSVIWFSECMCVGMGRDHSHLSTRVTL